MYVYVYVYVILVYMYVYAYEYVYADTVYKRARHETTRVVLHPLYIHNFVRANVKVYVCTCVYVCMLQHI